LPGLLVAAYSPRQPGKYRSKGIGAMSRNVESDPSVLGSNSPEFKRFSEKIESARAAGYFILTNFFQGAWDMVQAYDRLVRESSSNMENGRLYRIVRELVPEAPFDNEDNYPSEELFVGEVPPPVADVQGATLHYAVYSLARQTLAKIYDAAKMVDTSFPEVRNKDGLSVAEYRRLPDELFGERAVYEIIGTNHGWNDTRFATCVCRKLKLAPIRRDKVILGLEVEYLRAESRSKIALSRKIQQEKPASVLRTRHSADFRSVHWFGKDYSFTANQAACVKVLWEPWENGTPELADATILETAGINSDRLDAVFRNSSAWGTMIQPGQTKGTHQLGHKVKCPKCSTTFLRKNPKYSK
jgi:hypothetical protein